MTSSNSQYPIGILAYGSLINNPGDELAPLIIERIPCMTPFNVEYARLSLTRDNAPTLIPVQGEGSSTSRSLESTAMRDLQKLNNKLFHC